jgi:OOP family OmpA-OmpF porin
MQDTQSSGNGWRWMGAILLVLLLIVLWLAGYGPSASLARGCCGATQQQVAAAPAATAPVVAPLAAATVQASIVGGKVTLRGQVDSDATKKQLLAQAEGAFGPGNVIDELTVGTGIGALGSVTLLGQVGSDSEKTARGDAAARAFGASVKIDDQLMVQAPAVPSATVAPDCSKAMQLNVEFASGSARLTSIGKRYLDQVVKCISAPTEVAGHTDNRGSDALNQRLSVARANAVKAYLVSKGVKAELLTTAGYGASKPVASNDTDDSRARNRRIELLAK